MRMFHVMSLREAKEIASYFLLCHIPFSISYLERTEYKGASEYKFKIPRHVASQTDKLTLFGKFTRDFGLQVYDDDVSFGQ